MVRELMVEIPTAESAAVATLSSLDQVRWRMRKDVLAKLAEKIAACAVDEVIPIKKGRRGC